LTCTKDTSRGDIRVLVWDLKRLRRIILLTGSPGIGKTTVLMKTVEALKAKGFKAGGMLSREVRSSGIRVGFEILSLSDNERGWLARVNQERGPQVGKYRVNLEDLDRVGVAAIMKAIGNCDVIAIDEIGPMELFSDDFKDAVTAAIQSMKLVIAVVHWRERSALIAELEAVEDAQLLEVTINSRGNLHELIVKEAAGFLSQHTLNNARAK
jgi:nucleoside-triphosphatase